MLARHPGTTAPLCSLLDQEDASPSRDPCARGRGLGELLFGKFGPLDDVKVVTKVAPPTEDTTSACSLGCQVDQSVFPKKAEDGSMCLQAISCTNFETTSACCRAIVEVLPKDKGSTTDLLVEFHVEDSLTLGEGRGCFAGLVALLSLEENQGAQTITRKIRFKGWKMEDGVMWLR